MMDPLSRVDRKKKAARARILKAAEQLFVFEASYDQATIRAIARRADVSVGAVYLHFKTKADILAALVATHADRIKRLITRAMSPDMSGLAMVEALLGVFETLRRDDRAFVLYGRMSLFYPKETVDSTFRETVIREFCDIFSFVTGIIRKGIADGSIRSDMDPELRAVILMNIVMSFTKDVVFETNIELFNRFFSHEIDEVFVAFARFLLDAIRARPVDASRTLAKSPPVGKTTT